MIFSIDLYTAATIVFLERFLEAEEGKPKGSAACRAWDAALRALRAYGMLGDSAKRCAAALEFLAKKFKLDAADDGETRSRQGDWAEGLDAFWGAPDLLDGQDDLLNPGFLSLNFEDLRWLDSLPGSLGWEQLV